MKKEARFYHRLISIPIFQGLCTDEFLEIAERVPFDFSTVSAGRTIVEEGESCERLICTLNGTMICENRSDSGHYIFREALPAPAVIQPERLFGLRPRYSASFIAQDDVQVMAVSKREVRDVLFHYMPFHINYLNTICSAQHLWDTKLWHPQPSTLTQRFIQFLQLHTLRPAGYKELIIDMVALAHELVATRLRISHMLNELQDRELIQLSRRHIIIPSFEMLLQHAHTTR